MFLLLEHLVGIHDAIGIKHLLDLHHVVQCSLGASVRKVRFLLETDTMLSADRVTTLFSETVHVSINDINNALVVFRDGDQVDVKIAITEVTEAHDFGLVREALGR